MKDLEITNLIQHGVRRRTAIRTAGREILRLLWISDSVTFLYVPCSGGL